MTNEQVILEAPKTGFERQLFNIITYFNCWSLKLGFTDRLRVMHSALNAMDQEIERIKGERENER